METNCYSVIMFTNDTVDEYKQIKNHIDSFQISLNSSKSHGGARSKKKKINRHVFRNLGDGFFFLVCDYRLVVDR